NTMPTFLRRASLSSFSPWTSCPSTVIEPPWISFKALMQRIRVDLPEPEGPMMQITSPFMMSMLMPFSTETEPKLFRTSLIETIGCSGVQVIGILSDVDCIAAFQTGGDKGNRVAIDEEPGEDIEIRRDQHVRPVLG